MLHSSIGEFGNQNEIVFVLTPHIIRTPDVSEDNLKPLNVGTGSTIELQGIEPVASAKTTRPAGNPPSAPARLAGSGENTLPAAVPPASTQLPDCMTSH